MAEDLGEELVTRKKQSIARVELFTDAIRSQGDWWLTIHFEDGLYDQDGKLVGPTQFGTRRVDRRFADMAEVPVTVENMTVTIDGEAVSGDVTMSIAQLAAFIAAGAYKLRQQDVDAEAAKAEAERIAQEAANSAPPTSQVALV